MTRARLALALTLVAAGCVRATQFDRYYENAQWKEAAREFSAD